MHTIWDDFSKMGGGTIDAGTIALLIAYFAPTLIGAIRRHPQETPIFIINLTLGWTIIGWIAALAWSFGHYEKST